ncbi:MAG: hypothetical protein Q9201_001385 [Fulgogasparrea decipioides]
MKRMYSSIETVTKSFAILKDTLGRPCYDARVVRRAEESIEMCKDGIGCLHKKLKKIQVTPQKAGSSWNSKAKAHLQRALYPFKESTLVKLKEISSELQDHLGLALSILQIDSTAMSLEALEGLSKDMTKVSLGIKALGHHLSQASSGIAQLAAIQEDQHLSSVHDWLSPLFHDFASKHHETFNTIARQDGLGRWLLETAEYQQWLSSKGETIWCLGQRGIGKTVLASPAHNSRSFIINELQTTKTASTGIAFIYCNYNDPQKQNVINIVGSILQQLMLQNAYLAEELSELYERHRKAKTNPSVVEYSALLQSAVGYFSKTIVIMDALDECPGDTRDILIEEISKARPGVYLLITSRHPLCTLPERPAGLTVRLRANDTDITNYLKVRVSTSRVLKAHIAKDKSFHDHLVSSIAGKAKGMFLLARLQLDSLMAKPTVRKMKIALDCLPEELDLMYDQTVERIKNQDPEYAALALKLLYWVHYAIRPLDVHELRHALAVEHDDSSFDEEGLPDQDLLESLCGGIITLQEHGTVGLVHYTAQEYLGRKASSLFPAAEEAIAKTCLTYLSFDDLQGGPCLNDSSFEVRCSKFPLLGYASRYWPSHTRKGGETKLEDTVLNFLAQKDKLMSSIQAREVTKAQWPGWSQNFTKDVNGLWLSSTHGLCHICDVLLRHGADITACDSRGETALHRAAGSGHWDAVELLLEHNADLEARTYQCVRTPLHCAASGGHQVVVEILLARGARPGAPDHQTWTPLHTASSRGHAKLVALLLSQDIDIDATDDYRATALYRAADHGHEGVVQLLLEKNAQIDIPNDYNQTALHRAADLGHLGVTRLLLNHGANCELKDYYGWTPFYRAADHGHDEVAALLAEFAQAAPRASHSTVCKVNE